MYTSIPGIVLTGSAASTATSQSGSASGNGSLLTSIYDSSRNNATAVVLGSVVSSSYSISSSRAETSPGGEGSSISSSYAVTASYAFSNSGTSGTSGANGASGTSGTSGASGASGTSGTSGASGTSGTSGASGTSGTSGANGASGTSGTSGATGASGTSGTSGANGASGTSGTSGASGTSGTSGASGTSGTSAFVVTGSTYPITSSWAISASYALNGGGSSSGPITYLVCNLHPQTNNPPAADYATFGYFASNYAAIMYPDAITSSAAWIGNNIVAPADYQLLLVGGSEVATGSCIFGVTIHNLNTNLSGSENNITFSNNALGISGVTSSFYNITNLPAISASHTIAISLKRKGDDVSDTMADTFDLIYGTLTTTK